MSGGSRFRAAASPGWRAATLAVLVAGWLAIVLLNAPGHLSYDSTIQLLDGRTGRYHTWHPPFMAWLLGLSDAVAPGPGLYVALQAAIPVSALALLAAAAERGRASVLVLAALLMGSPLVLLWQAIAWKDVLFADLIAWGFVAVSVAFRARSRPLRLALLACGSAALIAAALVRQNGAVALPFAAAALVLEQGRGVRAGRGRRVLLGVGWLAASVLVVAAASAALATRSVDGNGSAALLNVLRAYDLVGVIAREPSADLFEVEPALAANIRRAAVSEYSPARNDALLADAALDRAVGGAREDIGDQWRATVLAHPLAWSRHRLSVFSWILFTPDLKRCTADFAGVKGPPEVLGKLSIPPRLSPRDAGLLRYAALFHRTPVYAHAAYGLIAAALALLLCRRRRAGDLAIAGLLLAALAYAASFLLIGVACDYRYLYALDLSAMVAVFYVASTRGDRSAAV